jgi:hypothetical protein
VIRRLKNLIFGALLIALGAFVIYRNLTGEPEGDELLPGIDDE